jgi:hypothetical protein
MEGKILDIFCFSVYFFDIDNISLCYFICSHYFPLSSGSIPIEPSAVVTPYICDPIKSGRNIVNSFRMHEVIQVWLSLYHEMNHGVSFEQALLHHQVC